MTELIDFYSMEKIFNDEKMSFMTVNYESLIIPISFMYFLICCYSYLAYYITLLHPIYYVIFYHEVLFVFWGWHYLCHSKFTGKMYEIHMEHHMRDYPITKFYGDNRTMGLSEILNLKNTTTLSLYHDGPLYIMFFSLLIIHKYMEFSFGTVFLKLILALIMGFVGTALHKCFHVKGIFLEKYYWFNQLRIYHYNHHVGNMKHNYGIFNVILEHMLCHY